HGAIEKGPFAPAAAPTATNGSPFRWVNDTEIIQWAERREGQDTLPELLSRLIIADVGLSADVRFPSGDGAHGPGWGGICRGIKRDSVLVPAGDSGWEIGAQGGGVWRKADVDFTKRSQEPLELDLRRSTFVFVAPRRLNARTKVSRIA